MVKDGWVRIACVKVNGIEYGSASYQEMEDGYE